MDNYNQRKKMFIIMSLSALLLCGSYKVYANDAQQIYKCIAQNGNIAYQDYACQHAEISEVIVFTAPQAPIHSTLRPAEIKALEHLQRSIQINQHHRQQLRLARLNSPAPSPQPQTLQLQLQVQQPHLQPSSQLSQVLKQNFYIK